MTNIPSRVGERYLCFVVEKPDRGWGGPWGQSRRPLVWRCVECGTRYYGVESWSLRRLADHHECGHAPCAYCGKPLLRRKDGTPRQHSVRQCPAKDQGYRIEREFARHIDRREYQ